MKRVQRVGWGRGGEEVVVEGVITCGRGVGEGEVLGVACAEELKSVFHSFLAGKFGAGEVVEDEFVISGKEVATFGEAVNVS